MDALAAYLRLVDLALVDANKGAYKEGVGIAEFTEHLTGVRERNRRRPSFMAMLDKEGLR